VSTHTRVRLLQAYHKAAIDSKADSMLIGGDWSVPAFCLENQIAKLRPQLQMHNIDNSAYFTVSPANSKMECLNIDTRGPISFMVKCDSIRSVVQPAPQARAAEPPPPRPATTSETSVPPGHWFPLILTAVSPMYDNLLEKLETAVYTNSRRNGVNILEFFSQCFQDNGKLLWLNQYGEPLEFPVTRSFKMESLMMKCKERRDLKLSTMGYPSDWHLSDEDMKDVFNAWHKDIDSWMRPSTLKSLRFQKKKKKQHTRHSGFNTYLFQLSGCKFLLHKLIQLPIMSESSSDEHPADCLSHLISSFEDHKKTKEYIEERDKSKRHRNVAQRLSRRVWEAECDYALGKKLFLKIRDREAMYEDLSAKQRRCLDEYGSLRSAHRRDRVYAEKSSRQPSYRGIAHEAKCGHSSAAVLT
jgi:hypothetical protein